MKLCLPAAAVIVSFFKIPTAYAAATYHQEVLADSPVAYWRIGETSGTTAVDEIVGGSQNGAYGGTYTLNQPSSLSGDANPSVAFNGGSFATGSGTGDNLFAGRSVLTVEFWVRPNSSQSNIHFLEYGLSGFSLESTSENPIFYVNNVNVGSLSLSLGTYAHIVLQMDGTNAMIWKDGVNVSTVAFTQTIADSNAEFYLASRNGNTRFVDANFDEVAIYTTALSPSRIVAHYNAAPIPEPGSGVLLLLGAYGLYGRRQRAK